MKSRRSTFAIRNTQIYNSNLCVGKVNRGNTLPATKGAFALHMYQKTDIIMK